MKKRRTSVDADDEGSEEEELLDGLEKHAAFADAMNKLLHRSVKEGAAPVLAKRHTAAEKRVALERREHKDARSASVVKDKQRKAHLVAPTVEPNIVLEKALRRIATMGGACPVHPACPRPLLDCPPPPSSPHSCCTVQRDQGAAEGAGDRGGGG